MEFLWPILAKIESICQQTQVSGVNPSSGVPERMTGGWWGGLAMWAHNPLWPRQSQCIFRPTNHKGWYKPIGGQISYPTDSPNATRLGLCSSLWTYQEGTGSTINTITDIQRAAQKISVPLCPHRENVLLQYDCFLCFECFVIRLVSLFRQCSFPEELYIVPRCVAGKFCTMSLSVFELGKHSSCEARWALHVQVTWKFQAPTVPPAATKSGLCFWHTPPELVFLWWLSMVMEQVINTRVSKVCPQSSTCFEMHCLQKAHIWKEQYTTWKHVFQFFMFHISCVLLCVFF